jgi:dynein heavy chain 1
MNGLSVYQIQVSSRYTAADFDDDLRHVLRRAGCKGEKICFIMDESNVLDSGFLGDEYTALMTACREGSQRDGLILDSNDELYRWFSRQIASNLHVVFTMNPPVDGLQDRVSTSPALFNRCVLDWFGDWSATALSQVATELTSSLDLDKGDAYSLDSSRGREPPIRYSQAIARVMVNAHEFVLAMSQTIAAKTSRKYHVTPRHFLDL